MAVFDISWQQYAMLFELLFIGAVLYNFRTFIMERVYGHRFKKWLILDTGEYGHAILNKSLNEWKILGQKRSVAYNSIQRGWVFYYHDNAENVKLVQTKLENDDSKWTTICTTEEFNTVNQTKIFQMLLYVMEKNWIMIIAGLVVVSIVVSGYGIYMHQQQQGYLDYIVWRVNQTAVQKTGDIVVNR